MFTSGRVVPVSGIKVDLIGDKKEELAFALRHLADTLENENTVLVNGLYATLSDTGRTVGEWRVV